MTNNNQGPLIYGRMAKIMREVSHIDKRQKNTSQNFMYRGIDDIMNELHSVFSDNEVFIIPEVIDYSVNEKITEKEYNGKKTTSILYYTRARVKYHFTTTDGSEIVTTNVGEAMDSGDKSMNKAMSIALKYALLQMLLIPTQEDKDPDGDVPPPTRPKTIREIASGLNPDTDLDVINVLEEVASASDKHSLVEIYNRYTQLFNTNNLVKQCFSTRRKELGL